MESACAVEEETRSSRCKPIDSSVLRNDCKTLLFLLSQLFTHTVGEDNRKEHSFYGTAYWIHNLFLPTASQHKENCL